MVRFLNALNLFLFYFQSPKAVQNIVLTTTLEYTLPSANTIHTDQWVTNHSVFTSIYRSKSQMLMKRQVKNLGWIKDYPDFRDFSPKTDRVSTTVKALGKQDTVEEMLTTAQTKAARTKSAKSTPKKVSLREYCTPVKDQGEIGACTAFAAVGMYEYYQKRAFNKYFDGSERFIYKATRNMLNWDGDTGAYIRTAMGALALFGVPPSSYYEYDTDAYDDEPPAFVYTYGQSFQALTYYRLDPLGSTGKESLANIKKQLRLGIPVMMGFTCYNSLTHDVVSASGEIPYPSENESVIGGHAVLIVGYDDNNMVKNPYNGVNTRGALIIRNSWGTGWGDGGYGLIPYKYVYEQLASDFWCMMSAEWVDLMRFGV